MVALNVRIRQIKKSKFEISCDNLKREDATDDEVSMANKCEVILREALRLLAEKVYSESITQTGPGAV